MNEFELIRHFFTADAPKAAAGRLVLGVGDDAALLELSVGQQCVVSTDTLVQGQHFLADWSADAVGHRALAVNLSDLAAMGAQPMGFLLALTLPAIDLNWLAAFRTGLMAAAQRYCCPLIGGDTVRGPCSISITVLGSVPAGLAITRSGAKPDDDIWVSGQLGDARLALDYLLNDWPLSIEDQPAVLPALYRPEPRLALGEALRGVASAAIDLSDGLVGDLQHVLVASDVAAWVDADALPRSPALTKCPLELQRQCTIAGGDDYELCFTAAPAHRPWLAELSGRLGLPLTRIGGVLSKQAEPKIEWRDWQGMVLETNLHGFEHFASPSFSVTPH